MSEYKLKPCPFCGGEVTIAEGGYRQTRWMYVTRGNKENRCNCYVFMESKTIHFHHQFARLILLIIYDKIQRRAVVDVSQFFVTEVFHGI